jgi:hypothetical protein
MGEEDVREQVVVAVPAAAVVERDHEQVRAVQRLEHGPPAAPAGDGVAQRAAEAVQDGGLDQEAADVGGLPTQHLLDEVVDDVPVVPGEPGDEAGHVVPTPHRQRGQLERGDPAFGASLQGRDVGRSQLESGDVVEVGRRLVEGEAQVSGSDLDQLAAGVGARCRRRPAPPPAGP